MDSRLSDCLTGDSEHLSRINYDLLSDSDQSAHRFDEEISSVLHSGNSSAAPNFCLGRSTWDITANTEQLSADLSPNVQYFQRGAEESPQDTLFDQRPEKKRKSEDNPAHNAKKHKNSMARESECEVNPDVSSFECDVSSITENSGTTPECSKNVPRKSMFPVMDEHKTLSIEDSVCSFDVTKSQVSCDASDTSSQTQATKPRKSIYFVNSDSVLSDDVSAIDNVTFTKTQESTTSNTCVSNDTNRRSKVHSGPRKSMFVPRTPNISSETSELEDLTFSKTLNSTKAGGMMSNISHGDKSSISEEGLEQSCNSLQDDLHADLSSFEKSKSFIQKQRSKKSLFAPRTQTIVPAAELKKTKYLEKSSMLEENSIGSLQGDSHAEFSEMSSFERSKSIVQKQGPKKSIFVRKTADSEIEINTQSEIFSQEDSHVEFSEISSFEKSKSIVQKRGPKKSIFVRKTDDSEIEESKTQLEISTQKDSHAQFSEISSFEKSKSEREDPKKYILNRTQTTESGEEVINHQNISSQEHFPEESDVLGCKSLMENQYPRKSIYFKELEITEGAEELSTHVEKNSSIIEENFESTESLIDDSPANNSELSSFERSKSLLQKQGPKKSIFVRNNQNTEAAEEISNNINWEKSCTLEENSKTSQEDSLADFSEISSFERSKSFAEIQQPKKSLFARPVTNESNTTLNDPSNFDFEKSKSSQELPKKSMFVKQNTCNESNVSDLSDFESKSTIERGTRKSVFHQANGNYIASEVSNMTDISDSETSKISLSNTLTKNHVDNNTFTLTIANNDTYTIGSANQTAETGMVEKNNETFTANNPVSSLDILPIISSGIYNTENIPGLEDINENQDIVETQTLENNVDKTNNLITQKQDETLKGNESEDEDPTITMDRTDNNTLELSDSQVCSSENSALADASAQIDENLSTLQETNEASEFDESSKNNSSVDNSTTMNETENSVLADASTKMDEKHSMLQEINEATKFDESSKINSSEDSSTTMNKTENSEVADGSESSKINSSVNNLITINETGESILKLSHNHTTSSEKSEFADVPARIDGIYSIQEETNEEKECYESSKINYLPDNHSITIEEIDNELCNSQTGHSEKSGTNEARECDETSEINTSEDHSMTMEETDNSNVEESHNQSTSSENGENHDTSTDNDDKKQSDETDDGYRNVSKILNETSVTRYFNEVLEECSADEITRMNCETLVTDESNVDKMSAEKSLQPTLLLSPMLYEENLETFHQSLELPVESNTITLKNANTTVNHTQLVSTKEILNDFEKISFTKDVLATNEIWKPKGSTRVNSSSKNLESTLISEKKMETFHQCPKSPLTSLKQNAHANVKNSKLLISSKETIEDIEKSTMKEVMITAEEVQVKGNMECILNNHTSVFHERVEPCAENVTLTSKERNHDESFNNTQLLSPKETVNDLERCSVTGINLTENRDEKEVNMQLITNDEHDVNKTQTSPVKGITNKSIEKENLKKVDTEVINNAERKKLAEFGRKTLAVMNSSALSNSSRLTRSLSRSKKTKKQIDLRRKTIAFTNVSRSYDSIVLNSTEDFSFDSYNGCSTRISMGVGNQTQPHEDTSETNKTPRVFVAENQPKPIGAKISMEPNCSQSSQNSSRQSSQNKNFKAKTSTIDETVQAAAKRGKRKALLFRSNLSLDNNPSSSSADDRDPKSSPSLHQEKSTLNSLETPNSLRKSARLSEKSFTLDKSMNITLKSDENLNTSGIVLKSAQKSLMSNEKLNISCRSTRSGLSEKSMNSTLVYEENINTSISISKSARKPIKPSLKSNEKLNISSRSTSSELSEKSLDSSLAPAKELNTSGRASTSGGKSMNIQSISVDKRNTSGRATRSGEKSINSPMTSEEHDFSEREILLPQKSKKSSTLKFSETTPIQTERLESNRKVSLRSNSLNKFANVPMAFSPISKRVNLTRQSSVSYNGSDDFNVTSGSAYLTHSQNVCETISVNSSDNTNSRNGSTSSTASVNNITGESNNKSGIGTTNTGINSIDKLSKSNSVGVGTNTGTVTSMPADNASDDRSGSRNITGSSISTNNHSDTTSSSRSRRRKQRTLLSTSTLMDPIDDTQSSSVNPESLTASIRQNAAYRTNKLLGNLLVQSKNRDASTLSLHSENRDTSNLSVLSKNQDLNSSTVAVSDDGIESFKHPLLPKRYSQAAATSRSGSLRAGSSSEGISLSISNLLDTTDVSRLTQSQFLKHVNKNSTQISSLKSSTARKVKPSSASVTGDISSSNASGASRSKTSLSNIDISSIARDKTESSNMSESQRPSRRVSSLPTPPPPTPPPAARPRRASRLDYQSLVYSELSHSEHPENSILRKILFTESSPLNESCTTIASDVPARKPRKGSDNRLDIVLENGELYKPKPMFKHKRSPWIHKGFYKYLESKLKAKYKLKTRLVSEFCAKLLHEQAEELRLNRYAARDARSKAVLELVRNKLVGLGVVECNWDFFCFCHDYLPPPVAMCAVRNISAKGYFDKLEYVESEDEED